MTGSACATVLIQPGRSSSGTLTPQKTSSTAKTRLEKTASSRTRSAIAACAIPSAVHENAAVAIASTSSGSEPAASSTSSRSAPNAKLVSETARPIAITGRLRPRKSATRLAGDASRCGSVCARRSPAIAWLIAKSPGSAASWIELPTT